MPEVQYKLLPLVTTISNTVDNQLTDTEGTGQRGHLVPNVITKSKTRQSAIQLTVTGADSPSLDVFDVLIIH